MDQQRLLEASSSNISAAAAAAASNRPTKRQSISATRLENSSMIKLLISSEEEGRQRIDEALQKRELLKKEGKESTKAKCELFAKNRQNELNFIENDLNLRLERIKKEEEEKTLAEINKMKAVFDAKSQNVCDRLLDWATDFSK